MGTVLVRNADRMMTAADPKKDGIHLTFADGRRGIIPFADLPEIEDLSNLQSIELPNPYAVMLRNRQGGHRRDRLGLRSPLLRPFLSTPIGSCCGRRQAVDRQPHPRTPRGGWNNAGGVVVAFGDWARNPSPH